MQTVHILEGQISDSCNFFFFSSSYFLIDSIVLVNTSSEADSPGELSQSVTAVTDPASTRTHERALCSAAPPLRQKRTCCSRRAEADTQRQREGVRPPPCDRTRSADLDIANPNTDAPVRPSCREQKETQCVREAGRS